MCCIASLVGGEVASHVVARHLRKSVSLVEAMVIQPLTILSVMHCHGNKEAHAHATAVVATPREHRALLVAKAAAIYDLVVRTIVNRHIEIDVLGVNQKHASAVSTTLSRQLFVRVTQDNITDLHVGIRH